MSILGLGNMPTMAFEQSSGEYDAEWKDANYYY